MAGDDRVRFCGQCRLNVYNISAMSPHEAMDLVARREGRLCVRFFQRRDGTILTEDCPTGVRMMMRKAARLAGIVLSALVSIAPAAAQSVPVGQTQITQAETGLDLLVVDVQGSACAGARVELAQQESPHVIVLGTDNEGRVHVSHLSPGIYTLRIKFPGFEPYQKALTLRSGVHTAVEAILQVAATQGAVAEMSVIEIPLKQSETVALEPMPVPVVRATKPGLLCRWFSRLLHPHG